MKGIVQVTCIVFCLLWNINTIGQHLQGEESGPMNNVYIDFLGDASIVSVNYERMAQVNAYLYLTMKAGIGVNEKFVIFGRGSDLYLTIPHHLTGIMGKTNHFIEAGLGGTIIQGNTKQNYFAYPIIGYRYQSFRKNKFLFRLHGSIPFTGLNTRDIFFIPIGLGVGINF